MRLLRFARNDGAGARMRRRRDHLFTAVSGDCFTSCSSARSARAIKVFTNFRHYCSRTNPMTSVSLFRRP